MKPDSMMASNWMTGLVSHRRLSPVGHRFQYRIGMLAISLDEWSRFGDVSPLASLERFNWLSLKRRDYLDPDTPDLRLAVENQVEKATGWRPDGAIELVTHPRYLGYVFNPVSFYFCYRRGQTPSSGDVPPVILAQITNTPWHERHVYCLQVGDIQTSRSGWRSVTAAFDKRFHVSPFNPMDQDYLWTFRFRGPQLAIHMAVNQRPSADQQPKRIFDASLVVRRTPLSRKTLNRSLMQAPLESFKVIAGIYWHALKLKLKGVPFHDHPDKLPATHPQFGVGRDDQGFETTAFDCDQPPLSNGSKVTRISSWRT